MTHETFVQEPYRALRVEQRAQVGDALAGVDLSAPGERTADLVEPFPGDPVREPLLPKLAMLLWEGSEAIQRRFPDPLRRDRRRFLIWYVWEGALELGLHADLVRPVAERLTLGERWRLAWSGLGTRSPRGSSPREGATGPGALRRSAARSASVEPDGTVTAKAHETWKAEPRRAPPTLAVNVAAHFQATSRDTRLAQGTLQACAAAGLAGTRVDLDVDPWGSEQEGLLQLSDGAPGTVLVAHIDIRLAPWLLGRLPAASTLGVPRVLYLGWDFDGFPESQRAWLHHFDEVWVSSRLGEAALSKVADTPVRFVAPAIVPLLHDPERERWGMSPDRIAFLARFDAQDPLQRDDPWSVLEAVRRLVGSRGDAGFELVLEVRGLSLVDNVASPAGQVGAALEEAARGLPVRILKRPTTEEERDSLLASCDALIALHRADGVGLDVVRAMGAGLPVIATDYGAPADHLAKAGGFAVGWTPRALGRNAGFLPGSVRWAEPAPDSAAAAMAALVEDPQAARARALTAAGAVRALHDPRSPTSPVAQGLASLRASRAPRKPLE
jgi:glycosyltransferase involved in cell wall biosynthesis